jgi:3-phenylpropionate/cinnamic acid dioxygenase small subunit
LKCGWPGSKRDGLAEDPPSRTRRLIRNLEATPLENGEVEVGTAFLVYRSHLETDHQLSPDAARTCYGR